QDLKHRLMNGRLSVHAAADNVIIKQQLIELEEEGNSLGEGHKQVCVSITSAVYFVSRNPSSSSKRKASEVEGDTLRTADLPTAAGARKPSHLEGIEEPPHLALHFDLLSNESEDDDFHFGENDTATDSSATGEELTGEIPEPINLDRLVGPGEFSSQVSAEGRLVVGDCDISTTLMKHRRTIIKEAALADVDELLLTNFVVSRTLLLRLFTMQKVDEVFPPHDPVALQVVELEFVGRLASLATSYSYDKLRHWFDQQPRLPSSIVYRAISSYLWEAGLWSDCDWYKRGVGENEDTFTNCLIKPLLGATFGDFAGCSFRWSRDALRSGKSEDPDARLQLPDYQVSLRAHAVVLGEFKTALAPSKAMQDDYVKLVFMGKKALDGMFRAGYSAPVILIHGRGMSVDVYRLSILSEAIYHLQSLGTFRLISGPLELPLLLSAGPLVSAREIALSTFEMIKQRKRTGTDLGWLRGTFDFRGITIHACCPSKLITASSAILVGAFLVLPAVSSALANTFSKDQGLPMDTKEYKKYTLIEKTIVSSDTALYEFALPNKNDILNLPIGQHVTVMANINGKDIVRSYTPVSSSDDIGHFVLCIKSYPNGNLSSMFSKLAVGDTINARGPKGNFNYTPNMCKEIGMIAGGTGLTPMLQIIRAICKNPADKTLVHLIFANHTEEGILLKNELDLLAATHPQFKVHYVVNKPSSPAWTGGLGHVNVETIQTHLPKPSPDVKLLLCGPPPMVSAMGKIAHDLGFTKLNAVSKLQDQVFKF
ncbi:NADH-cytochrome b5 reductase, partial [Podila epigama]